MQKTFNLRNHLTKLANLSYEGAQGYFLAQTRAWMNCIRCKQKNGEAAQKSWQECFDEFQKGDRKLSWIENYAKDVSDRVSKESAVDYSEGIERFAATGLPLGVAVSSAIEEKMIQVRTAQSKATQKAS